MSIMSMLFNEESVEQTNMEWNLYTDTLVSKSRVSNFIIFRFFCKF